MSGPWQGWQPRIGPLVDVEDVPPCLRTLIEATADLDPEQFRRFLPQLTEDTRPAAVLIVFGADEDGEPDVLLQLRADGLGAHAGQVSFPGGAAESVDADPMATALREATEEVGLRQDAVRPLALLPALHVPVSRFQVTPVIAGWVTEHPVRAMDPAETAAVLRVPLKYLADPANRCQVRFRERYKSPAFLVPGMLVWGFTAGLIQILLSLGGWDTAWDEADVRELDQAWSDARALPALTGKVQT